MASEAMRYLAAEQVAAAPLSAGILLANEDATRTAIHVTVVGAQTDPGAIALHNAALRSITSHELIELRDPSDANPLPTDISYPHLNKPALYLCTATACSSPVFRAEEVRAKVQHAQLQPSH